MWPVVSSLHVLRASVRPVKCRVQIYDSYQIFLKRKKKFQKQLSFISLNSFPRLNQLFPPAREEEGRKRRSSTVFLTAGDTSLVTSVQSLVCWWRGTGGGDNSRASGLINPVVAPISGINQSFSWGRRCNSVLCYS